MSRTKENVFWKDFLAIFLAFWSSRVAYVDNVESVSDECQGSIIESDERRDAGRKH